MRKKKNQVFQQPVEGEKSLTQKVIEAYKELYGAEPKPSETAFYVKFFTNRDASPEYMKEIISTSAPTLQKTLKAGTLPLIPDTPQGTEDEVISIFNEILERQPDAEEVQYYSTFIKAGPANVEKMKLLLLQSNEYKRLQKLQNNTAYGYLLGGITDRQLTIMVVGIYNQVSGSGNKLDEDTLKFLKKKYLEFQLDEQVFKKFIQDFIVFDSKSKTVNQPTEGESPEVDANTNRANAAITDKLLETTFEKENKLQPPSSSQVPATSDKPQETSDKKEQYTQQCPAGSQSQVDTDKLIKAIKENADCQFSKNGVDDQNRDEPSMADTINDRNRDELKNICQRNKTFSKYHHENMVLLPGQEWSVPQKHPPVCYGNKGNYSPLVDQTALIGTLLGDAKDTEIGSIMPKFSYKEYYD